MAKARFAGYTANNSFLSPSFARWPRSHDRGLLVCTGRFGENGRFSFRCHLAFGSGPPNVALPFLIHAKFGCTRTFWWGFGAALPPMHVVLCCGAGFLPHCNIRRSVIKRSEYQSACEHHLYSERRAFKRLRLAGPRRMTQLSQFHACGTPLLSVTAAGALPLCI